MLRYCWSYCYWVFFTSKWTFPFHYQVSETKAEIPQTAIRCFVFQAQWQKLLKDFPVLLVIKLLTLESIGFETFTFQLCALCFRCNPRLKLLSSFEDFENCQLLFHSFCVLIWLCSFAALCKWYKCHWSSSGSDKTLCFTPAPSLVTPITGQSRSKVSHEPPGNVTPPHWTEDPQWTCCPTPSPTDVSPPPTDISPPLICHPPLSPCSTVVESALVKHLLFCAGVHFDFGWNYLQPSRDNHQMERS